MATIATRLRIESWDEDPVVEFDDGSKITRAAVVLADGTDGVESGRFESVMYYRADGTSSYVNVMRLTATLEGRSGSFTLTGDGTFDGTTAAGLSTIVVASADGDLVGIAGTCSSASTHADYPFMPLTLDFDLP